MNKTIVIQVEGAEGVAIRGQEGVQGWLVITTDEAIELRERLRVAIEKVLGPSEALKISGSMTTKIR